MRHHAAAVTALRSTLLATIAVLLVAIPATARAQIEAPPPEDVPPAADVVIPDRAVRMSTKGLAQVTLGCLGENGDLCLGAMTISLARAVEIPRPEPQQQPTTTNPKTKVKPKPPQVVQPFTFTTFNFGIVDGAANRYRFQLPVRAQKLLLKLGRLPVQFSADFAGKNGVRAVETRVLSLYVPLKPPELPPPSLLR